jgi:hypothetical protein
VAREGSYSSPSKEREEICYKSEDKFHMTQTKLKSTSSAFIESIKKKKKELLQLQN